MIHAKPFQPQGKGKIERFFRTCRAQLISQLTGDDTQSLESINRRLGAWLEGEYHHCPHRGLDGQTPLERWAQVAESLRYPDQHLDLEDLFLFETTRKVNKDRTVSLHGKLFEVDPILIGERITLRFNPANTTAPVQVVHQGRVIEMARPVDLYANCFVKRHRRTGVIDSDTATHVPDSLNMRSLKPTEQQD